MTEPMTEPYAVALTTDPAAFLAEAGELLAGDPVVTSVVATVTQRAAAEMADAAAAGGAAPDPGHPQWWAVVRDAAGTVVGAAMRTAPFEPHPAYVLPMPEGAARALARAVHERGEELTGVNGALPAARTVAEETAALTGGEVVVDEHLRLWEHPGPDALVDHTAPGRLRPARVEDVPLCVRWWAAFAVDSAEQGGRTGEHPMETETIEGMTRRVELGLVWLWEDEAGEVVHLTAHSAPAYGVVRVGPVYTPGKWRGHGYASAAVAQVTRRVLEAGDRACLFTDQANPTSNRIYAAIGYRPVADTANLLVAT